MACNKVKPSKNEKKLVCTVTKTSETRWPDIACKLKFQQVMKNLPMGNLTFWGLWFENTSGVQRGQSPLCLAFGSFQFVLCTMLKIACVVAFAQLA